MKQYVTALHKGKTESTIGEEQLLKFKAKESGEIQVTWRRTNQNL